MAASGDLLQPVLAAVQHHGIAQVQECADQLPAPSTSAAPWSSSNATRLAANVDSSGVNASSWSRMVFGGVPAFGGDDDPQPVTAVGQVRHVGDTGELARLDQRPDPVLHSVARDTGRQFGDDDVLAVDRQGAADRERTTGRW
ncbi:hypothetical protein MAUB1S_00421 [Mycolicibacterium aubagnense]